jgi:NTE family protein
MNPVRAYGRKLRRLARRGHAAAGRIGRRFWRRKQAGPPSVGAASLASRSVGLPSNDLIKPCRQTGVKLAPSSAAEPPFALAFSGGGFRASLAAAGVVRFAADTGILGQVRYASSVSGGSITNGLLAANYEELESVSFAPEKVDELVIAPLIRGISRHSFNGALVRNVPRIAFGETRTEILSRLLDRRFFKEFELARLSPSCRFIFNAANLSTGVRFTLERERVGDYVIGYDKTSERKGKRRLRVADAVAASAAFPGAFSPLFLDGYDFPCKPDDEPALVDGGTYDNLGLEALGGLMPPVCLIAINAGGLFHTGFGGGLPLIGNLKRDSALLYRQSTSLRTRILVERFQAYEQAIKEGSTVPRFARRGVLFSLATTPRPCPEWDTGRPDASSGEIYRLANLKTSFAKLAQADCEALIGRGWWLTGATMSCYHRSLLPPKLPHWRPFRV